MSQWCLATAPTEGFTWGGVQVPRLTRPGRAVGVVLISEKGARGARLLRE
jgi:hypothetical protein